MSMTMAQELPELLAELSLMETKRGHYRKALVLLSGLRELQPDNPSVHVLEGLLHFAKEDFGAAERSYRSGLEAEPGNELAKTFLAESLIPQRRYREAERLLEEVLEASRDGSAHSLARSLSEGLRQGLFQRVQG